MDEKKRSDMWLCGVSHGAAADEAYAKAQERLGQALSQMGGVQSRWEQARNLYAQNPTTEMQAIVDSVYAEYVILQKAVEEEQQSLGQMQQSFAAGVNADQEAIGNPLINSLVNDTNGIVTQIQLLENQKATSLGALSLAQAEKMGSEVGIDLPVNIDDWGSFKGALGQGAGTRDGVDDTINHLTEQVASIDEQLNSLYQQYDMNVQQYNALQSGQVVFGGLDSAHLSEFVEGEKSLGVTGVGFDPLSMVMPDGQNASSKELDVTQAFVEEPGVVYTDETGMIVDDVFDAEELGADLKSELVLDSNADAFDRLCQTAEVAEANSLMDFDFDELEL